MNLSPTSFFHRLVYCSFLILLAFQLNAQPKNDTLKSKRDLPFIIEERMLQVSVWPGLMKNSGEVVHYGNNFSLNLFYGLSGANYAVMLSGLQNRNLYYASGLQISGFYNKVRRTEYGLAQKSYHVSPYLEKVEGVQLTAGINYVGRDINGAQIAGFMNNVLRDTKGLQISGIGNHTSRYLMGAQVSLLVNSATRKVNGYQVIAGVNFTQGDLRGLQLGLYNRAKRITQNNPIKKTKTFQVGLINSVKSNAGYQIGLINITRKMYGTQIGLINIYRAGPYQGDGADRYGAAIGLLNYSTKGEFLAIYLDESLMLGGELTTGNCTNCKWSASEMPYNERYMKLLHNAMVIVYDINDVDPVVKWKVGYGIDRVLFNKHSYIAQDPKNKRIQLRYGARLLRILYDDSVTNNRAYELKLRVETGYRIVGSYLFVSGLISSRWSKQTLPDTESSLPTFTFSESFNLWPGLMMGIRM